MPELHKRKLTIRVLGTHFLPGLGNTVFPSQKNVNPEPPPPPHTPARLWKENWDQLPFRPSCTLAMVLSVDCYCQAEFPGVCSLSSAQICSKALFFCFH